MLRLFFKYLRLLKPYSGFLILVFLGDLAVSSFNLVTPLFSKMLFDYAYPLRDMFLLNAVIAASVGLYFIQFFVNVLCDYLGTYVEQGFSGLVTNRLFLKCQYLPMKAHQNRGTGDLVNLFTHDIGVVVDKSINTVSQVVLSFYSLASILAIAFFMNPKITLLALFSLPLYVLETKYFARKEEKLEERDIALDGEYFDVLSERFNGIKTIKAFGQERLELERVARKRREMNVVAIKRGLVAIIAVFANSVTVRLWSVFLGWYMGRLVIHGELSVGEIVALLAYVTMMGEPIQNLSKIYGELKVAMVSYRRIDAVIESEGEDVEARRDDGFEIREGRVSFEHVEFAYDEGEENVLKDLDFRVAPRTAVAIVGESGSGKSTVVSLLMRFYTPQGGAVRIDGHNVTEVGLARLRGQIGLVEQDFCLFAGTLRDNIMYGNAGKSEEDLIRACRQAQIYDFIRGLEDGFDHEIGTGGEGLSGGQKQRVAIARVLLRDPRIIIFDEATSALDPESEYRITEVINGLIGKKSLFIIAHRLSTIKKVNTILMIEDGRIAECGTFHELLDRKGAFFRYHSRQFGGIEAFKKILEIEYERVGRYGSRFNLIAARLEGYGKVLEEHGDEAAFDYVDEATFFLKKHLRKGDSAAAFYGDVILILLPEIDTGNLRDYFSRMDKLCSHSTVVTGGEERAVRFAFSAVHAKGTPFETVDEVLSLAVDNLKKASGANGHHVVEIAKAAPEGKNHD